MTKRTIRDFTVDNDLWSVIDPWALDTGFRLIETIGTGRLYQKGHGFWVAPMMMSISKDGNKVHLEAWIKISLFVRISTLFIMPTEMGIESGGFRGAAPRGMARKRVNMLLKTLNQPQIP